MTRATKICAAAFLAVVTATVGLTAATASDRHGEGEEEHERGEERGGREGRERGRAAARASAADPGAAALYRKECGACHLAFPPSMLSAESHRRTMAGLGRHFGQNAELDAPVRDRLERWLVENAGDGGGLRITEQARFQREHREVRREVWSRASVRSPANCAACHGGAQDWDFDEDRVKIPR